MRAVMLTITIGLLSSCATESAMLVNGSGQTLQCNNQGWGWLGAPMAVHNQHECLDKAKAAGYREVLPGETIPATQKP
jgi:hypothetical protein